MFKISYYRRKKKQLLTLNIVIIIFFVYQLGCIDYCLEKDFHKQFDYPYNGNINELISKLKHNQTSAIEAPNFYNFHFYKTCNQLCIENQSKQYSLIFLIKSATENFKQREAIRKTWASQLNIFNNWNIKFAFLLGIPASNGIEQAIDEEFGMFNDIIQANYTDSYFNNTYKTMSAFYWAVKYCSNTGNYFMFVDDDYYVSIKNVLKFLNSTDAYPINRSNFQLKKDNFYTGYQFNSAPLRIHFSKWYISVDEYPYNKWPPYISGGAYILSKSTLHRMYYGSLFVKHFRFDDIYLGILAYKLNIPLLHSSYFHFYKISPNDFKFKDAIASHGYHDSNELIRVWNGQNNV